MAGLATRQKIILGVTGIAVLYGAVDFLMPKKKDIGIDVKQKTEDLNTFVTTLSAGISKDTAISLGPLIFARAEKEWAKDPFLDEKSLKEWIKAKEPIKKGLLKEGMIAPKIEFSYAGYIEVDRKRMAIINGIEYGEGDALDIKGFVLKSVSPARVVIVNTATKATLTVPLQE
ncbi:MAG: hypothetical protein ABIJ57_14515 [Pseudomonadota bacterium]